jgi:hypothetical protein
MAAAMPVTEVAMVAEAAAVTVMDMDMDMDIRAYTRT